MIEIVVGIAFGGVAAWGAYIGIYDQLTETRRQSLPTLPSTFWHTSLAVAALGAFIGGIVMWRVGAGR